MMHPLPSDLTERERQIVAYFNEKLLQLSHRIATQNKFAARAYLKPHEQECFDAEHQLVGKGS